MPIYHNIPYIYRYGWCFWAVNRASQSPTVHHLRLAEPVQNRWTVTASSETDRCGAGHAAAEPAEQSPSWLKSLLPHLQHPSTNWIYGVRNSILKPVPRRGVNWIGNDAGHDLVMLSIKGVCPSSSAVRCSVVPRSDGILVSKPRFFLFGRNMNFKYVD